MARGIERLTPLFVTKVRECKMHPDGANLYLNVVDSGATDNRGKPILWKSWIFRFKSPTRGKIRDHGLGPIHTNGLGEARELARKCRQLVKQGIDPIDYQKEQRHAQALEVAKAVPFKTAAEEYIKAHRASWVDGAKSEEQWTNSLTRYAYPVFGDWPVKAIDTPAVLKVIEPIWLTKHVTAVRVRRRIEKILNFCTTHNYRPEEPNPARWGGHLEHLLPDPEAIHGVEHFASLPYQQIGAFIVDLRATDSVVARQLEFMILSAMRPGAVLEAKFAEIDEKKKVWTIPASRMKGRKNKRRDHRVPLTDRMLAIVEELRKASEGDFIFTNTTRRDPLRAMAMTELIARMKKPDGTSWTNDKGEKVVAHGFRSSFATWTSERTSVPTEIREMALAHVVGNATTQAYDRSDLFEKRRVLMEEWTAYCSKPEKPAEVSNLSEARRTRRKS